MPCNAARLRLLAGAVILAAALALRVQRLGVEPLWEDEAFSFHAVTGPTWLADLRFENLPPLYFVVLHGWIALAGDDERALRLLSALLGTLFVAATMWAARELFDAGVALWSGLVAAASPMGIYYSQEARPYALLTTLVVAFYAVLWRALRTNRGGQWVAVGAFATAALYTHYLAALALLPTAFMLAAWPVRARLGRYLCALAVAGAAFAPWVVWSFVLTAHPPGGIDWVREAWQRTPPWLAVPRSLEVLYFGSQAGLLPITLKQFDTLRYPVGLRIAGLGALAIIGVWATIARPRSTPGSGAPRLRAAILWALLLGPLLTLWLLSWTKPIYVAGRYDQLALPPIALLLGLGLERLQAVRRVGPVLAGFAAVALLVPAGAKLVLYYREPARDREQSRITAETLIRTAREGDLVIFTGMRQYAVAYRLHRLGYRLVDGRCEPETGAGGFLCGSVPHFLGPLVTPGNWDRSRGAQEIAHADIEQYVTRLGPPGAAVHVVLGTHAIRAGRLSVAPEDAILLGQLEQAGYSVAAGDSALGIVVYRRGDQSPPS